MLKLECYDFDIHYVKGEENVLADLASRPPGVEHSSLDDFFTALSPMGVCVILSCDVPTLIREHGDVDFIHAEQYLPDRLNEIDRVFYYQPTLATADKPAKEPVVLIPPGLRDQLMNDVHNAGHQGSRNCISQLRRYCFWKGMYEDV